MPSWAVPRGEASQQGAETVRTAETVGNLVSKVLKRFTSYLLPMYSVLSLSRGLVCKASLGTYVFVRKLYGTAESRCTARGGVLPPTEVKGG